MELRIKFLMQGGVNDQFSIMLIQNGKNIPNVYFSTVQHQLTADTTIFQIPNYVDVFSLVIQFFLKNDVMVPINLYSNQDKILYDQIKYTLELQQSQINCYKHFYLSFFQLANQFVDQIFQNNIVIQLITLNNIVSQTLCKNRQDMLSLNQPLIIQQAEQQVKLNIFIKLGPKLYKLFEVEFENQNSGQAYQLTLTDIQINSLTFIKSLIDEQSNGGYSLKSLFNLAELPQDDNTFNIQNIQYYNSIIQELSTSVFRITLLTHEYFINEAQVVSMSQLQLKLGAMLSKSVTYQNSSFEQLKYGTISPICINGYPGLQFVTQILYVDDVEGRSTAIVGDSNSITTSFAEKQCKFAPNSSKQAMRSYNNLASKNVRQHVSSNSYESSSLWANYMPICLKNNTYNKKNVFIQLYDTQTYDILAIGHIGFQQLMKYFSYSTQSQQDIIIQVPLQLNVNNYHFCNCTSEQLHDTLFLIAGGIMDKDEIAKYADYEVDDNNKQQFQQNFEQNDLELDFSLNMIERESLENRTQNDPIINLDIEDDFDQEDDFDNDSSENDSPEVITLQDKQQDNNEENSQSKQIESSQLTQSSYQIDQSLAYDNMVDITSEIDRLYPINQKSPDQIYINSTDLVTFQNTFQGDQPFLETMLDSLQQRKQLQKMAELEKNLLKTKKHTMKVKEQEHIAEIQQIKELPEDGKEVNKNTEVEMDTCDMELLSAIPAQSTPLDINSILSQLPSSRFGQRNQGTAEYEQDDLLPEQVDKQVDNELGLVPDTEPSKVEPKKAEEVKKPQPQTSTVVKKQQQLQTTQKKVPQQQQVQQIEVKTRKLPVSYKPKFLDKYQDSKGKTQVKKQSINSEQYNYRLNLVKMGPKAQKLLTDSQGENK